MTEATHEEELQAAESDQVFPEDAIAEHYADVEVASAALMEFRRALSDSKIKYLLAARVGVPNVHPNQPKGDVERLAKYVETLTEIINDLRSTEVATIPYPPSLEVASIVPEAATL